MLANAGDVFYIISLLTLVFEKTHSAVYTGFVPLTIILAQTVSGFLTPLMQRRFSLSTLLFLSQFAKTILLGLLVFVTQWSVYILRSRALFTLTCMDVLESLAGAIYVAAIMLFYVSDVLGKGQEWWGYLNASYFVGMIAGGLLLVVIATHVSRYFLSFLLGAGLFSALVTLGLGVTHSAWVALFLSFLLGPATQIQYVSKQTYFQRNVDSLYLPNVLSAKSTVEYAGYGLSVLILTNVVAVYGAAMAYIVASGILIISLLLGLIMRRAFKMELGKLNR